MLMMLPPFGIEMLQRFLSGEEHPKNVSIKHSVELLLGDFFQRHEFVHAGVVDQTSILPNAFSASANSLSTSAPLRDVALDSDSFSAAAYVISSTTRSAPCLSDA